MRKLLIVMGLVLVLGISHLYGTADAQRIQGALFSLSDDGCGEPVIEWWNSTEGVTIAWDGAYTGQTQEVCNYVAWVNDTDGVDTVLFRYQWIGETEWMNRTASRIIGNATNGQYRGNLTYAVWWNYTSGYPQTEGSGGNFHFKIWANDTMGNWAETNPMTYTGGYMIVSPPPDSFFLSPMGISTILIVSCVSVVVILIWVKRHGG
ncbi:MAG: hypothetical protein ACFFED_15260 [Candidatus Thorarchaeota archaeon]